MCKFLILVFALTTPLQAIVSIKYKEIVNEIFNDRPNFEESSFLEPRYLKQKYPPIKHRIPHNTVDDTVPSFKKITKDLITSPQHTEVFRIRVRRDNSKVEKPKEILNIPLENRDDRRSWDVLDLMSHLRYSFFGKLFDKEIEKRLSRENKAMLNEIGEMKMDAGLFQTVKSTLTTIQETPDPFLMVVFGGRLSDIRDQHTPLIQTIKFVVETTEPETTLIILTGSCPENEDNLVVIKENVECKNPSIPVFTKGPQSEKFANCHVLYDVPLVIRSLLEESSPNFKDLIRPKRNLEAFAQSHSGIPQSISNSGTTLIICFFIHFRVY